eukprot:2094359-Rhodomonas_salina.2
MRKRRSLQASTKWEELGAETSVSTTRETFSLPPQHTSALPIRASRHAFHLSHRPSRALVAQCHVGAHGTVTRDVMQEGHTETRECHESVTRGSRECHERERRRTPWHLGGQGRGARGGS